MRTTISESDVPKNPIKVKSEAKSSSSSRYLKKQASISNSSGEVYYGDSSVAIPFRWESQPGTPKVRLSERRPLPPLTPPPSYQCSPARNSVKKHPVEAATANSSSRILPKLNLIKKSNVQSSPSLSSSSSSSSSSLSSSPWSSSRSVPSSPFTPKFAGGGKGRKLSFYARRRDDEDDEDEGYEFHVSSLCFGGGVGRSSSNNIRSRGGSASLIKLLLRDSA